MLQGFIAKILQSLVTIPQLSDWQLGASLVLGYGVVASLIGFGTGLICFKITKSFTLIVQIGVTSLVAPALLEELIFRACLLPFPTKNLAQLPWSIAIASIIIFTLYHPLNALTFFPQGRSLFLRPSFLVLASLLGFICLLSYWQSGSLWLPTIIHWFIVSSWLVIFDGYDALYQADSPNS